MRVCGFIIMSLHSAKECTTVKSESWTFATHSLTAHVHQAQQADCRLKYSSGTINYMPTLALFCDQVHHFARAIEIPVSLSMSLEQEMPLEHCREKN